LLAPKVKTVYKHIVSKSNNITKNRFQLTVETFRRI